MIIHVVLKETADLLKWITREESVAFEFKRVDELEP